MRSSWLGAALVEEPYLNSFLLPVFGRMEKPPNRVIVYPGIQMDSAPALLLLRSRKGEKVVLIHLSDEKLRHRRGIYKAFDLVLRNYFDPRLSFKSNVYQVPLGWTEQFNSREPSDKTPAYLWSFCGAIKADREKMLNQLKDIGESFTHISSSWGSDDQLPPDEVRTVYEKSCFVLCPQGNAHIDSFRVMEALQAGAVPVSVKFLRRDFFRFTFGNHPFVVADDWDHAGKILSYFEAHPDQAIQLRTQTRIWYQEYLKKLEHDIAAIAEGAPLRKLKGEMFRMQKLVVFDLPLLVRTSRRFAHFRK